MLVAIDVERKKNNIKGYTGIADVRFAFGDS